MKQTNKTAWLAWTAFSVITFSILLQIGIALLKSSGLKNVLSTAGEGVFGLTMVVFAFIAALILSRQPHNVIGWLMMFPAIAMAVPVDSYLSRFSSAPANPSWLLLAALWFSNWSWLLLIFPILFTPLLFPTGRPPSPRWRWIILVGLVMCAILIFFATFASELSPAGGSDAETWSVTNPIGFINTSVAFPIVAWGLGLIAW